MFKSTIQIKMNLRGIDYLAIFVIKVNIFIEKFLDNH